MPSHSLPSILRTAWHPATLPAAFLAFLLYTLVVFWNPAGFYFWDEWDGLHLAATVPVLNTLFVPHNEHVIPIFRLYFRVATGLAGEHYGWALLGNCLIHSLNGLLMLAIMRALRVGRVISLVCAGTYVCCLPHWENLLAVFQASILGYVTCSLLMLLAIVPDREPRAATALLAAVAAIGGAWFFGAGLVLPAVALACAVLDSQAFRIESKKQSPAVAPTRRLTTIRIVSSATALLIVVLVFVYSRKASDGLPILDRRDVSVATERGEQFTRAARFALVVAGHTPLARIVAFGSPHIGAAAAMTISSLLIIVCWLLLWPTRFRLPLARLAIFHAATLFILGMGRAPDDLESCASRYQAFVLIAPILTLAMVLQHLIESPRLRRFAAIGICAGLLLLLPVQARHAVKRHEQWRAERGTMLRAEYDKCKSRLRDASAHAEHEHMADFMHPMFSMERLRHVVRYLQ